jgi:putative acetyltransferase
VEVRIERSADEPDVRRVHLAAFGTRGAAVADLTDALRAATPEEDRLSLVAVDEDRVSGHALFTRAWLDAPARLVDVSVLSPLGVLPQRHRQGIGTALVRAGLGILAGRGVPVVFLEGDPGYYGRLGFASASRQGFRTPSLRIPDAGFQAIRLTAEPWMTGTLVYPDTFWRHDAVGLRPPGPESDEAAS